MLLALACKSQQRGKNTQDNDSVNMRSSKARCNQRKEESPLPNQMMRRDGSSPNKDMGIFTVAKSGDRVLRFHLRWECFENVGILDRSQLMSF